MSSPLRPELYRRLVDFFGKVVIAHEGDEMLARAVTDPATGHLQLEVDWPGEYYRIQCPFCTDLRFRLWINHRWALYVPELKSDNLWLAHCFNEDCLSYPGKARLLRDRVFSSFIRGRQPDPVRRGRPAPGPPEFRPVGTNYQLQFLPAHHHASLYLRSRGYDPDWLGRQFGVSYCPVAHPELDRKSVV